MLTFQIAENTAKTNVNCCLYHITQCCHHQAAPIYIADQPHTWGLVGYIFLKG
jgi:hypothetical protein